MNLGSKPFDASIRIIIANSDRDHFNVYHTVAQTELFAVFCYHFNIRFWSLQPYLAFGKGRGLTEYTVPRGVQLAIF